MGSFRLNLRLSRTNSKFFTSTESPSSNNKKCGRVCNHIKSIMPNKNIYYSDKYNDEEFEYRHVMLPKDLAKMVPKTHLMSETEWRNLGVQQSQGWVHYMTHDPEPHILLFRRDLTIYGNQNNNPNRK